MADRIRLHYGDMTDSCSLFEIIETVKPDEIYNLAAQSHVKISFSTAEYTGNVNALGVLRILEAVRNAHLNNKCRIYQASTSELFGKIVSSPQNEKTPFQPVSPYGIAKQYAYWMIRHYRESYGIYACNGILFNHESERRGENFVTRKISLAAARIRLGLQDHLELGNLDALRDWGYAKDYVECMWLMLQQEHPDDYVIATGEQHSVREFVSEVFRWHGIEIEWRGTGLDEKGYEVGTNRMLVCVNAAFFRPAEVVSLCGDPSKARQVLGWDARKTSFTELCGIMAKSDWETVQKEKVD